MWNFYYFDFFNLTIITKENVLIRNVWWKWDFDYIDFVNFMIKTIKKKLLIWNVR